LEESIGVGSLIQEKRTDANSPFFRRHVNSPRPRRARPRLTGRVTKVVVVVFSLQVEGRTRAAEKGDWSIRGFRAMNKPSSQVRGLEMNLLGSARFDRKLGRFVGFELVAVGTRWGGTQHNNRGNDLAPATFGVVLSLAGDSRAERVAPEHFHGYGWR
jgi:hypothetical protein